MSNFRVKASSCTQQDLSKGFLEGFLRAQTSQTGLLILVSQINIAKSDDRLERMLGEALFNQLVKRREHCNVDSTIIELQPYDFILKRGYRAQGRTILIINPALSQLVELSNAIGGQQIDVIAVEIQLDGELDSWVKQFNAQEL
ncbi:hypothetical protein [Serratia fonticola]